MEFREASKLLEEDGTLESTDPQLSWCANGAIVSWQSVSEEVIREVRDLPDGMYTFAYELSVEVIIGASWGYISNERIEVGPSEIRKQIGEGDDARWDPLPEPDDEVGGPDPQRG